MSRLIFCMPKLLKAGLICNVLSKKEYNRDWWFILFSCELLTNYEYQH